MSFDAEALTRLSRVGRVAPSPCGGWVAVAVARIDEEDARYVGDLWRVGLTDDAEPVRLTWGDYDDRAPAFREDGALLFLSDRPRNPKEEKPRSQVWCLPTTGEPTPVTDEPLGVTSFRVAGGRLVVVTRVWPGVDHEAQRSHDTDRSKHGPSGLHYREMPVRVWDHWVPAAHTHLVLHDADGRRDLTPDAVREHLDAEWDLAPDGERVVVTSRAPGPDRIDDLALEVIATATGAPLTLGRAPRTRFEMPRFAPDSRRVVSVRHVRQDSGVGPSRLWLHDVDTPDDPGQALAPEWDAIPRPLAWVGESLWVTADAGGRVPVFQVDLDGTVSKLTDGGVHEGLVALPDGSGAVGVRHTLTQPPAPFVLRGAGVEVLGDLSGFAGADFAGWTEFEVTAPDGRAVRSFLVTPTGEGPHPVFFWIHGGPMNQFADGWHWRWSPLVPAAAGYAVVMPNPRGSTGVDQAFTDGVWDNRWGAECYDDLMAVADALAERPELDVERMVAMGGSFGGYMANWIGGQTDRFRALVSHAGIFHFSAFHGTTDFPGWFHLQNHAPGDPPEALDRYSPHRHVEGWRTPTLVIHGEKDYRVPISEALLLFEALQREGVESELLVFPDENHWIIKPRNIRTWYGACLDFVGWHWTDPGPNSFADPVE